MRQRRELTPLLELSARVGQNPLLTQASTGNASMKLDDRLWIKASGKWMADALCDAAGCLLILGFCAYGMTKGMTLVLSPVAVSPTTGWTVTG